jgi:FAD-dependent oxidoreductase domain-containing protein 1
MMTYEISRDQNSSKKEKFDVIVVGAGIVGLACAYHILSEHPTCRLVIVDKAPSAGQGDTAKTVAGVRNTFTSEVNRLLAETSIDFYKHVQEDLKFDLHLEFTGYLWLLSDHLLKQIEPLIDDMRKSGVELRLWEQDQLSEMLANSHLSVDPSDEEAKMLGLATIVKGLQGVKCGTLAAEKLVEFYEKEVRRMGAMIRYRERVRSLTLRPDRILGLPKEPLVWQHARIGGVLTDRGQIEADQTLLAAGNWSTELLNAVGVDSQIRSKKRQVFALRGAGVSSLMYSKGFNEQGVLPLTMIPPCSIYLKSNGREQSLWTGVSDDLGRPFSFEEEPTAEEDFYTYNIYPILTHYFPNLKNVRPHTMWAGHYDINTIDANPYVFQKPGLIVAVGMSGSGISKADAIGRIVSAVYAKKEIATLYGGKHFKVARLGIKTRQIEPESFVI